MLAAIDCLHVNWVDALGGRSTVGEVDKSGRRRHIPRPFNVAAGAAATSVARVLVRLGPPGPRRV